MWGGGRVPSAASALGLSVIYRRWGAAEAKEKQRNRNKVDARWGGAWRAGKMRVESWPFCCVSWKRKQTELCSQPCNTSLNPFSLWIVPSSERQYSILEIDLACVHHNTVSEANTWSQVPRRMWLREEVWERGGKQERDTRVSHPLAQRLLHSIKSLALSPQVRSSARVFPLHSASWSTSLRLPCSNGKCSRGICCQIVCRKL